MAAFMAPEINMRSLLLALCLGASLGAIAAPVPNLICNEAKVVYVDPRSLDIGKSGSQTVYRFADGKLFLKPADRDEYLYGKVDELEPLRYGVGHKVVLFDGASSDFRSAVAVHTHRDEVRVSRLVCKSR